MRTKFLFYDYKPRHQLIFKKQFICLFNLMPGYFSLTLIRIIPGLTLLSEIVTAEVHFKTSYDLLTPLFADRGHCRKSCYSSLKR
jgi:hypothetical protein